MIMQVQNRESMAVTAAALRAPSLQSRRHSLVLLTVALLLALASVARAANSPTARRLSNEFAAIVEEVSPTVVHIATVKMIEPGEGGRMPGGQMPEFFERFFGVPMPEGKQRRRGLGSGVIVSSDGYVLTNNHVVEDATRLTVKLKDGREFEAETIGTDPATDIAVVQIDGENLPVAELGDSDTLSVGEFILAIGNPLGLDRTVTSGIVSATGRANVGIAEYEDFIQTDAAINLGNSGGPIVDMKGKVVGVSTAIFSQTGGSMGIGFAVPINMAQSVMNSIIEKGEVVRGWLGVSIQDLTSELAKALETDREEGALVGDVIQGTPAEKAGMRRGDLIVEAGGEPVGSATELRNRVASMKPGSKVTFKVVRDGDEITIPVTIGRRPDKGMRGRGRGQPEATATRLGLRVENLNDELRERFDLPEEKGVLVVGVDRNSSAFQAGIRPGTLILEVNRDPVGNVQEFNQALRQVDADENVLLLVSQRGATSYVLIKPRSR